MTMRSAAITARDGAMIMRSAAITARAGAIGVRSGVVGVRGASIGAEQAQCELATATRDGDVGAARSDSHFDGLIRVGARFGFADHRADRRAARHRYQLLDREWARGEVRQALRRSHRDRSTDTEHHLRDAVPFEISEELL
jgi:hypothetical protein